MFFNSRREQKREEPDTEKLEQAASRVAREFEENSKQEAGKYLTCPMPDCLSLLVYPKERYEIKGTHKWKVLLVCPNCLTNREITTDREIVRELLKNARVGRERLMKELTCMEKRHMEEEVDKFTTALQKDQILPEDFVPSKNNNPNEAWI